MLQNPRNPILSQQTKNLIDKLMSGKFSLAEIARIVGVPEEWLQSYVDTKSSNKNKDSKICS